MLGKRSHAHSDFELNLTPIIDCFVTLICFMLLSATYVSLVGMDAKVPIAVPASSPQAQKEPTFKLEMNVKAKGVEVIATGAGKSTGKKWIANTKVDGKDSVDYVALHAELIKVKQERPKEFSIYFNSESEMPYGDLVKLMDATRNLDPKKDPAITIQDERNGQTVKMDVLFPDFVMSGMTAIK